MKNPNLAILLSAAIAALVTAVMSNYGSSEGTVMVAGLVAFVLVHLIQGLCFTRFRSATIPSVIISQHPQPGQEYAIDHDAALSSAITQNFAEQRFKDKNGTDPTPESKGRTLIYQKTLERVNTKKSKKPTYDKGNSGFTIIDRSSLLAINKL